MGRKGRGGGGGWPVAAWGSGQGGRRSGGAGGAPWGGGGPSQAVAQPAAAGHGQGVWQAKAWSCILCGTDGHKATRSRCGGCGAEAPQCRLWYKWVFGHPTSLARSGALPRETSPAYMDDAENGLEERDKRMATFAAKAALKRPALQTCASRSSRAKTAEEHEQAEEHDVETPVAKKDDNVYDPAETAGSTVDVPSMPLSALEMLAP